jgi:hypothetical protein
MTEPDRPEPESATPTPRTPEPTALEPGTPELATPRPRTPEPRTHEPRTHELATFEPDTAELATFGPEPAEAETVEITAEPTEYEVRVRPPTTLRTVLAVALVVAVFCCGGLGLGGYVLFRKVAEAHSPIRNATGAYLGDLETGDYAGAYARLCRATRERLGRDTFVAEVSDSAIRAHHIDEVRISNDKGRLGGTVTATLVNAAGAPRRHTFELTSEDGAWKVCGDPRTG